MIKKALISTFLSSSVVLGAVSAQANLNVSFGAGNRFVAQTDRTYHSFNNYNSFKNHLSNNYSSAEVYNALSAISKDSSLNLFSDVEIAVLTDDAVRLSDYATMLKDTYGVTDSELDNIGDAIRYSGVNAREEVRKALDAGKTLDQIFHAGLGFANDYAASRHQLEDDFAGAYSSNASFAVKLGDLAKQHPTLSKYSQDLVIDGKLPAGAIEQMHVDDYRAYLALVTEAMEYSDQFTVYDADYLYYMDEIDHQYALSDEKNASDEQYLNNIITNASSAEDVDNFIQPDNITTNGILATGGANKAVLLSRIGSFNNTFKQISGLASGEFNVPVGVWIKGTLSKGQQKSHKMEPGYKFQQHGISIGADMGDDFIFGGAYSLFDNKVDSVKKEDTKEKIQTHVGAVYGIANFGNFYVSGQSQFGYSKITKDRHTGDNDKHIAKGKTTGAMYGFRLESGYNFLIPSMQIMITPSAGLQYSLAKVKGYKETGLGLNRRIADRSSSRTDAVAGIAVKKAIQSGSFTIIPELHTYVTHAIGSKNGDTKIALGKRDLKVNVKGEKLTDTQLEIGATIGIAAQKSIEVSAGYDLDVAKKFVAHTGSLKLRVNF